MHTLLKTKPLLNAQETTEEEGTERWEEPEVREDPSQTVPSGHDGCCTQELTRPAQQQSQLPVQHRVGGTHEPHPAEEVPTVGGFQGRQFALRV